MVPVCNKENMRLWVAALRSGDYQQGVGALQTEGNKFCCLGVACEIAMIHGIELTFYQGSGEDSNFISYDACSTFLPAKVAAWLGIGYDQHSSFIDVAISNSLSATAANDNNKMSFDEIADAVEVYYEL